MAIDSRNYDTSVKVSQDTIDRIKKMGMKSAIAASLSGESPEFREGVKRMYGSRSGQAAADKMSEADTAAYAGNKNTSAAKPTPKPTTMPSSAPAVASRRSSPPGLSPA